jgi:hypothetical protein
MEFVSEFHSEFDNKILEDFFFSNLEMFQETKSF